MRVVAMLRLILHVRRRDRDPARAFFRRIVNLIVRAKLAAKLLRHHFRHRRRQRRLTMVNVTNRATFTCGFVRSNFPLDMDDLQNSLTLSIEARAGLCRRSFF